MRKTRAPLRGWSRCRCRAARGCPRARPRFAREPCRRKIQHLRMRADKDDSRLIASPRERGVLAQKSVARMDGVAAFFLGSRNELLDIKVGGCAPSLEPARGVGLSRMQRRSIVF